MHSLYISVALIAVSLSLLTYLGGRLSRHGSSSLVRLLATISVCIAVAVSVGLLDLIYINPLTAREAGLRYT